MRIQKILNNNAAMVRSEEGGEIIVTGKGLCFGKKTGDLLCKKDIEKEFVLKEEEVRSRFQSVVAEAPYLCVQVSQQIIERAKSLLNRRLNENIYVALTDHIHFSIQRFEQGLSLQGKAALWDVQWMYPDEYQLGKWGRGRIEEALGVALPEEESAFIALHIVSAELGDNMQNVLSITKIVPDILELIQYHFGFSLKEESLAYYRLVTHLTFFAQRVVNQALYDDSPDDELFSSIQGKYPQAFACVKKIALYIESTYPYTVTREEKLYLTVHIERLIRSLRSAKQKKRN